MFIYCFDKETQDILLKNGYAQLNPSSPPPFIFSNHDGELLASLEMIKNRYVITNELIYLT